MASCGNESCNASPKKEILSPKHPDTAEINIHSAEMLIA
jgi:hypothetical protein